MDFPQDLEDYFINNETIIKLYPEDIEKKFSNLKEFYDFISQEVEFWKGCGQGEASKIRAHFTNIINDLNNYISTKDNSYLRGSIGKASMNTFPCVYSLTSVAKFIKDRYLINYRQADAACDYLIHMRLGYINNELDYMKGIIYSFFINEAEIAATKQLGATEESFLDLRSRYTDELTNLHNDYYYKSNKIEEEYHKFKDDLEDWKQTFLDGTKSYVDEKEKNLKELETLYQEKLRLEAPADYWNKLYNSYITQGIIWTVLAVIFTAALGILLTHILYSAPNSLFVKSAKLNLEDFKGTIVFATIVSIGIYLIRLFVKLALSSYHLSRDSKERYQLTYVYLSLLKEKGVTENERTIVLQSIFSRSDTGLLKGDSSPTIPDGVMSQILKNIK